jgi:hypothetical protein
LGRGFRTSAFILARTSYSFCWGYTLGTSLYDRFFMPKFSNRSAGKTRELC